MTESTAENGHALPPASMPDVRQLLQECPASYLNTSRGAGHLKTRKRSREDGRRNLVRARLTPEQLTEAQRLAREWDEAHPR